MRNRILDPFQQQPVNPAARATAGDWLRIIAGSWKFVLACLAVGAVFGLLLAAARPAPVLLVLYLMLAAAGLAWYYTRNWWGAAAAGVFTGGLALAWPGSLPLLGGLVGAAAAGVPGLHAWRHFDPTEKSARLAAIPVLALVIIVAGWLSALTLQRAAPLQAMFWMGLLGLGCGLIGGMVGEAARLFVAQADRENALFSGTAVVIIAGWLAIGGISASRGPVVIETGATIESLAYPSGFTHLHFTSNRDGSRQIYRQDVRTGEISRITNPSRGECWMPRAGSESDLYVTCTRGDSPQVYRQNPKTGAFDRMTQPSGGSCWEPALGPNNNTFFTCNREGLRAIYYQDRETGGVARMTDPSHGESWSPALGPGDELYFTSDRDGSVQIYRLSIVDGSAVRMTNPANGECWSPALGYGDDLYMTCSRDGSRQIYRMDHRTGAVVRMTRPDSGENWGPVLGPNGNIHFTSNRTGKREVYRIDHATGEVVRMTNTSGSGESWTLDEE